MLWGDNNLKREISTTSEKLTLVVPAASKRCGEVINVRTSMSLGVTAILIIIIIIYYYILVVTSKKKKKIP